MVALRFIVANAVFFVSRAQPPAGFGNSGLGGPVAPGFGGPVAPGFGGPVAPGFGDPIGVGVGGVVPAVGGPGGPGFGNEPGFGGGDPDNSGIGGPGFGDGSDNPVFAGPGATPQPSCPDCTFNISAWFDFTSDFHTVVMQGSDSAVTTDSLSVVTGGASGANGTVAFDLLQMTVQFKFDMIILLENAPKTVNVNILMNGVARQASLHISLSPELNACVTGLVPSLPQPQEQQLQMIEAMSPMVVRQRGQRGTLDGENIIVLSNDEIAVALDAEDSHLALISFKSQSDISHSVKFSNYRASTDFVEAACTVAETAAALELLSNAEVQAQLVGHLRHFDRHAIGFRTIEPVAQVFAALPTNFADMFFPESSALSEVDMVGTDHDSGAHTFMLASIVLGLTAGVAGVLLRMFDEKEVADVYENLEA